MKKAIFITLIIILTGAATYILLQRINEQSNTEISSSSTTTSPSINKKLYEALQTGIATDDIRNLGYSGMTKIVGADNSLHLVYRAKTNGYYEPQIANVNIEGSSATLEQVSIVTKPTTTQRVPTIAKDSSGTLYVFWYGSQDKFAPNNRQIHFSKSSDNGKSWSQDKIVSYVDGYTDSYLWQEHPSVTIDQNNNIYLVWEGKDLNNIKAGRIKFSKSTDLGESWSTWKNIDPQTDFTASRPIIRANKDNNLHVMYYSGEREKQIWHIYSQDGGETWSSPQNLSNSDFDSRHVTFEIDNDNIIYAAWREQLPKNEQKEEGSVIKVTRIKPAETQNEIGTSTSYVSDEPKTISGPDRLNFFPNIALNKNTLGLTWINSNEPANIPSESPESGTVYFTILEKSDFYKVYATDKIDTCSIYPHIHYDQTISNYAIFYTECSDPEAVKIKAQLISF